MLAGTCATLLVLLAACGKMEQQKPPADASEGLEDASMDLGDAAAEAKPAEPAETTEPEPEVDARTQCCEACVAGVDKDTSGDPPGALNCAMLDVGSACVLFFDKNPMTGKEAKACVAESEGGGGGAAPTDG